MPSLINEHTQYTDADGTPIVNGKIYIGAQNADPVANPVSIYSDRDLTTAIANPQLTDGNGRSVNRIWVESKYSIQVNNSAGVQKYQALDAGELAQTGISLLTNTQGADTITADGAPAVVTLLDKQYYVFTAAQDNTGAVTLQINITSAKSIKKAHDQDLVAGDIEADQIVTVAYNEVEDYFEIQSNPNSGSYQDVSDQYGNLRAQPGYLYGLGTLQNTANDITIGTGVCVDSTATAYMNLTSALKKQIDAAWAEGDALGGFPSGLAIAVSTTYHFFLISKEDGTLDAGWDTSLSAVNLLADATDYIYYRRVASHVTDSVTASTILTYYQRNDYFYHNVAAIPVDYNGATIAAATDLVLTVPTGVMVLAMITVGMEHNSAAEQLTLAPKSLVDPTASTTRYNLRTSGTIAEFNSAEFQILTDTAATIAHIASGTGAQFKVFTQGWIDDRGKS